MSIKRKCDHFPYILTKVYQGNSTFENLIFQCNQTKLSILFFSTNNAFQIIYMYIY